MITYIQEDFPHPAEPAGSVHGPAQAPEFEPAPLLGIHGDRRSSGHTRWLNCPISGTRAEGAD